MMEGPQEGELPLQPLTHTLDAAATPAVAAATAAVPPRGLRGGLGLALAAGLSLGGPSRALSLCGWPARCLLGVGIDALLAQPELHGCLAASAEQQEELELPSSRPLRRARSQRAEAILQSKTDSLLCYFYLSLGFYPNPVR